MDEINRSATPSRSWKESRQRYSKYLEKDKHNPIGQPLFVIFEGWGLYRLDGGDEGKDEPHHITTKSINISNVEREMKRLTSKSLTQE